MTNETTAQAYTCPMHPEVISDKAGRCPKCGMNLVKIEEVQKNTAHTSASQGQDKITWCSYMPLAVIAVLIAAASLVAAFAGAGTADVFKEFILNFMTGFFLVFAGFKLMDLPGFAEGYSTYDLLAQRWRGYGYVYPFIELAFGLLMLYGLHAGFQHWLLWAEFVVMIFSGLGVAIKLARKEPFMCACLGTFLKVPLTYVTLIEDFGMALLALILIFL